MSDNLKKYSFNDLLKQGKIRIPKIQRDYAQGRNARNVKEIRKVFIHSLILVVKGKVKTIELDFVYGSSCNNAFEPLDGQQRLTTLFLLHWMLGVDLCVNENKKYSMFTYETRNTSEEFCDELVQHKSQIFINEAKRKNDIPSSIIKGRDWFKWEWKFDPTILSMLVMIDAIYSEMGDAWNDDISIYCENLNNITFNLLNLGEFGLSNELFIKMNARGKQLSDFDKLKSTLEEELQMQQTEKNEKDEKLATSDDENDWRSLMDGVWIDLFWHKYARQKMLDTNVDKIQNPQQECLNAAKLSEYQFKKLLLRLIALQLFESEIIDEKLEEAAYKLDENNLDNLLFVYSETLTELRSNEEYIIPNNLKILNFRQLIEDVNSLIYRDDNGIYYETSYLLSPNSHIENDERSLFDSFLESKLPNDVELTFYAMLLFLRVYPMCKTRKNDTESFSWYFNRAEHNAWCENLEVWVKSIRNILQNNNNNQRIDKIYLAKEATKSLKKMIGDLVRFVDENKLSIETDSNVVREFLKSTHDTYSRLDNQSLQEEREKASLFLKDRRWGELFDKIEGHEYLWGQIRCVLNWSNNDYEKCKVYSEKLIALLNCIEDQNLLYYSALLAFDSRCWENNNRLFIYNKDRDNSFKRYLRERTGEEQQYGVRIKKMIDLWMSEYGDKEVDSFLEALVETKKNDCEPWVQCIINCRSILDESWNKRIYSHKNHVILAQRKTIDSHCFDPIFLYFRNKCRENKIDEKLYKLYDSKGEYEHAFKIEYNDESYLIEWDESTGGYKVTNKEKSQIYGAKELIPYIEDIISSVENNRQCT